MEYKRVDIHGHLYQWVDSACWTAVVVGGTAPGSGKVFFDFDEAMAWVEQKPHFMLIESVCIRAFKIGVLEKQPSVSDTKQES